MKITHSDESFGMMHVHERLETNTMTGEENSLDEEFEFELVTEEHSLEEVSGEIKSEPDGPGQEAKLKKEEWSVIKSEKEENTVDDE